MNTSLNGIQLLVDSEGERLKAYRDVTGVWTIGVGHTSAAGPPLVREGMRISQVESRRILARDLDAFEHVVERLVRVDLTQNQFDALVNLVYNIGERNFSRSRVLRFVNAGRFPEAANAFMSWTRAGGRVIPALVRRRRRERAYFLKEGH